jgi:hypothetical protein
MMEAGVVAIATFISPVYFAGVGSDAALGLWWLMVQRA